MGLIKESTMAHKKKGHLTTSPEWAKHLRKYMKQQFWKGERNAAKKFITAELVENKNGHIKIHLPDEFYEYDENWKNSVHKLDFENADHWFDKRSKLLTDQLSEYFVSEEEYYYMISTHCFFDGDDYHKAKSICERAIKKGLTSERMVDLNEKITSHNNI